MLLLIGCDPPGQKAPHDTGNESGAPTAQFKPTPVPDDPGPAPYDIPSEPPTDDPPRFMGISQLIAGDGVITLQWQSAWDDLTPDDLLRYRVYISIKRQDESKFEREPAHETGSGELGVHLEGYANGVTLYVVVRAVDATGNEDDNELEWSATPNPVFYVQKDAATHGDGKSASAPLPNLSKAISAAITLVEGANIYIAEGEYEEATTFLLVFDGMMIYGGFPPGFPEWMSKPRTHRTVFSHPVARTLFTLMPGDRLSGVDGLILSGGGKVGRGIEADDCEFRISNCEIHAMTDKGIRLRSDTKPDSITLGEVSRCWIYDNEDSGIDMLGILDVAVTGCGIYENRGEGIEIEELTATANEKSRITIEGCRISDNQDVGIQIKTIALPDGGSSDSRIRLKIRSCEIAHNADVGVLIDVAYPDGLDINLRVRIEQCRIEGNQKSGIRLDGDARGHFQMTRDQILGNGGHGIYLTGDGPVSFYQIQSCAILANEQDGVHLDSSGHASIDHCHIAANGKAAFFRKADTWIRVEDSMFHDNVVPAYADLPESCIASEAQLTGLAATPSAPWLTTLPKRILRLPDAKPGVPVDLTPLHLETGSIVEWLDDGLSRTVITNASGEQSLDPPAPEVRTTGVTFIYDWGIPELDVAPSLVEDYRPSVGSPLRDTGNSEELEADGSFADIGPAGAFFAGHPGIDRGGAPPPRGLELSWIEPAPGGLINRLDFVLSFTGESELPAEIRAYLLVNKKPIEDIEFVSHGTTLHVTSKTKITAGDEVRLELPPWPFVTGGRIQPLDHMFEYRGAHSIELGTKIENFPAMGPLVIAGLETVQLPLAALPDRKLRLRLVANDPPGGRGWSMRLVKAGSGETVLAPDDTPISVTGDKKLDGALRLNLPPLPAEPSYLLVIDPPGESSFESDAYATLYCDVP